MATITLFDDLPDLALIELFSYLSSIDVLWIFTRLNHRLTALVVERGFFRHVNLSPARRYQFDSLLHALRLTHIESLTIDRDASHLQLLKWPHLPRLTSLQLKNLYQFNDALRFVLLHSATLVHLTIESSEEFHGRRTTMKFDRMAITVKTLMENILRHLLALRSLDLGMNRTCFVTEWSITSVKVPLTYLRVALTDILDLLLIMSTVPFSDTLRQLHVTVGFRWMISYSNVLASRPPTQLKQLHTFTYVTPFLSKLNSDWILIEALTTPTVMPKLRRANLAFAFVVNDLYYIRQSPIFNDNRHVDVHFALSLEYCTRHVQLTEWIPRDTSRHPRQIVGETLSITEFSDNEPPLTDAEPHHIRRESRQHLWYTLPWTFDNFFEPRVTRRNIRLTDVQVFMWPPATTKIDRPHLLTTLDESIKLCSPPTVLVPYVVQSKHINMLDLFYWNKSMNTNLPALRHITFTNSFNWLNNCSSLPASVRSIQIVLYDEYPHFGTPDWSVLRTLVALSSLKSLRMVFYNLHMTLDDIDDTSCEMIAETASMLVNFGIFFRTKDSAFNFKSALNLHRAFIAQLHRRILSLLLDQPYNIVEEGGLGLNVWF